MSRAAFGFLLLTVLEQKMRPVLCISPRARTCGDVVDSFGGAALRYDGDGGRGEAKDFALTRFRDVSSWRRARSRGPSSGGGAVRGAGRRVDASCLAVG